MMRSRICTRAVALIVAYAIVLHGFLIAFAGFPLVAGAPSDGGISRLELCLHDLVGGALPQPPSAPEGADVHCKFCIGQAHAMALAPPPCGAQLNFRTPSAPIWFVLNQVTTGFPRYLHNQRTSGGGVMRGSEPRQSISVPIAPEIPHAHPYGARGPGRARDRNRSPRQCQRPLLRRRPIFSGDARNR